MQAMTLAAPPQTRHVSTSILKTRFSRCAQVSFVEGDGDFNSIDNLAFQPHSGNLYVIEDHSNGDVFACLPDGADRDIKSDGCVKILSVRDRSAIDLTSPDLVSRDGILALFNALLNEIWIAKFKRHYDKSKRQYQKEPGRGCGCPNKAYEFESPGQLMEDFWKDVNEIVGK